MTGGDGRFELSVAQGARVMVVVYRAGFEAERQEVVAAGASLDPDVVLEMTTAADTLPVCAPAPPLAETATVLTPLDVVRTAATAGGAIK